MDHFNLCSPWAIKAIFSEFSFLCEKEKVNKEKRQSMTMRYDLRLKLVNSIPCIGKFFIIIYWRHFVQFDDMCKFHSKKILIE